MKVNKFGVAVAVIVILVIIMLAFFVAVPQYNKFIIKKQVEAQAGVIEAIMTVINDQQYIVLNNGNDVMVLVRNPQLEEQLKAEQVQ